MLKLCIVDDEPIIRNGIRGIIEWTQYGYEICGEAGDGPSAVEAILNLKPDLVLLDLHLPVFSGLEVIRKIRSGRGADVRFLIISGHAEFEYAKEAINLELDGYILKPIDENILVERITSIAQKIKRKDPQERRLIQFFKIMEGTYTEGNGPFSFCSGYVQAVFVSIEEFTAEEASRRMQMLKNFFQDDVCHVFSYREFMVFLFENTPETIVKHLLEDLCDYLEKSKGGSAVTLGSRCPEEDEYPGLGIQKTCKEAEGLFEDIFFYRGKKYLSLEDVQGKKNDAENFDIQTSDEKKLCAYIQAIDHKMIRTFFRELEEKYFRSGKSPQEIRQECMALIIETRSDLQKKFPAISEMLEPVRETLNAIMKLRYLGLIIDAMTETCLHITECLPLLSADSSLQRIISYVKNNYNEDLRLETLGQLFYYNPAYLGKRFKEYTGKNFHTYLDILRVDAAKKLLQDTDMKVYEISHAVVYTNTDYFYGKFKKHTGGSPLDFRKKEDQ